MELLIEERGHITDFYGRRSFMWDLTKADDHELAVSMLLSVCYLHDLHENKRLFHGDIKPENLFYNKMNCMVFSDIGSLIVLFYGKDSFHARTCTETYASKRFIHSCKHK